MDKKKTAHICTNDAKQMGENYSLLKKEFQQLPIKNTDEIRNLGNTLLTASV